MMALQGRISFLLCLDEGQQRAVGGGDANRACAADAGTTDHLLRGGEIGSRQH